MIFSFARRPEWRTPPQSCPDFWIETEGKNSLGSCYNIQGLGTCSSSNTGEFSQNGIIFSEHVDDTKYYYVNFDNTSGGNNNCLKQKWASSCGVAWDGITYVFGNKNPCQT